MTHNNSVLLVEDDGSLISAMQKAFEDSDIKLHIARDGEEGLRMAEQVKPGLILLDILMPKMDGMSLLKKIREAEWGSGTPVIVLTNLISDEYKQIAKELGAVEYIVKTSKTLDQIAEDVKKNLI